MLHLETMRLNHHQTVSKHKVRLEAGIVGNKQRGSGSPHHLSIVTCVVVVIRRTVEV